MTGQERRPGGILGKEHGCAVPCIPEVPRFPSVRCQPRRVSRSSPALPSSHSSLPESSSPISQSPSACPYSAPPCQGQANLAGKSPCVCPASTATLLSSPEPCSNPSDLFAAPSCGEGSGFCLAPSHPLCPASRGTSLSRAHQPGGRCHVRHGRKACVISALGRERLRERAGGVSREQTLLGGSRHCSERWRERPRGDGDLLETSAAGNSLPH